MTLEELCKELEEFFRLRHRALTQVLDAGGCREGWLQAEAFRYFNRPSYRRRRIHIKTNYGRHKNDLVFCEDESFSNLCAVVETKLLGVRSFYVNKNLTGYPRLDEYLSRRGPIVFKREHAESCHPSEGSVLKDYRKLLCQQEPLRILMLVLDMRPNNDGTWSPLGRVITKVHFENRKNRIVLCDKYPVRVSCWPITNHLP